MPPSGSRRLIVCTTCSVSLATTSRTFELELPASPSMAMKALVRATEIFVGSNSATLPSRRRTLYKDRDEDTGADEEAGGAGSCLSSSDFVAVAWLIYSSTVNLGFWMAEEKSPWLKRPRGYGQACKAS